MAVWRVRRLITLGAALTFLAAGPCPAQHGVDLVPFFGIYVPTTSVGLAYDSCLRGPGVWGVCGTEPVTLTPGPEVGLRLVARADASIAYYLSFAYVLTQTVYQSSNGLDNTEGGDLAHVALADAGLMFNFRPGADSMAIFCFAGPSVVMRGGSAFESDYLTLQPAGPEWGVHAGIGVRFEPFPKLALRADIEDIVYAFGSSVTGVPSPQNAVNFSFGATVAVAGAKH